MTYSQTIILSIVQGFTEFLPISSSAHLILMSQITGWNDQGITFDLAVHFGTLVAVILYFRSTIQLIYKSWINSIFSRTQNQHSNLAWAIIISTIPICIIGPLLKSNIEIYARSTLVIALTNIIFAILLLLASYYKKSYKTSIFNISVFDATLIGLFQCLAIIPGTSRSGITISIALFLGYNFKSAAKYSFLLAIPVIALAFSYEMLTLKSLPSNISFYNLTIGIVLSFFSAIICIFLFLKIIDKIGMVPFVSYRLILGIILILLILF